MEKIKIISKKREDQKKAKKVRAEGFIPAILYGPGQENISLLISDKEAHRIQALHSENALLRLLVKGDKNEKVTLKTMISKTTVPTIAPG